MVFSARVLSSWITNFTSTVSLWRSWDTTVRISTAFVRAMTARRPPLHRRYPLARLSRLPRSPAEASMRGTWVPAACHRYRALW
jgi:hypothetical protein